MPVPSHQRKALTSIANKNEVRGLCDAFGAEEVEDGDPPAAPQHCICSGGGSTAAATRENKPGARALPSSGCTPADTAGTG